LIKKITIMHLNNSYNKSRSKSIQSLDHARVTTGFLLLLFFTGITTGCRKFITLEAPRGQMVTSSVFENDQTAMAAMTSIYGSMGIDGISYNLPFRTGLYGDELNNYSTAASNIAYYQNNLDMSTNTPQEFWQKPYFYIYRANAVIEGCQQSKNISSAVKKQLIAEAKFTRAYWYFYLVNLFGDLPLVLSTDYDAQLRVSRSSVADVYRQITGDLLEAVVDLNSDYVDAGSVKTTSERVRPNSFAASALLARVYLYTKEYAKADEAASRIIGESGKYALTSLDSVFLKNSREAIWQIPPSSGGSTINTLEGQNFILTSRPTNGSLSDNLLQAFEAGDNRRNKWVGVYTTGGVNYYYPFKYKVKAAAAVTSSFTEYAMVLRLAEQYLIRAEARAQQNNFDDALQDLNKIRRRAGLSDFASASKEDILNAIFHERQIELFSEWGHRWLDMKRTGKVDSIMQVVASQKGGSWASYKQLWPIAITELDRNTNLVQNTGY
jgi:hypothetical protein